MGKWNRRLGADSSIEVLRTWHQPVIVGWTRQEQNERRKEMRVRAEHRPTTSIKGDNISEEEPLKLCGHRRKGKSRKRS